MRVVDLTHTITADMPVYPGTEAPTLVVVNTCARDGFHETRLSMHSHTGTHIDPPAHVLENGSTLDAFPVSQFVGKALVIDCRALRSGEAITMAQLAPYGKDIHRVDFLLFCLGYDKLWGSDAYFGEYPCIDDEVLSLILSGNYKGVGFDVIGIDPIGAAGLSRHKRLLAGGRIINIENLTNLEQCGSKPFDFFCLPLKVADSDGAPARAIACLP